MPKVSLVIPAYNSEKVIGHCLNSLLNQTFKDFEIIIVNDGSKDRTLELCNKFAKSDNRIKVVTKNNEGRVLARRMGYKLAQGEFLGFVDHDDYLPKNAISCLYDLIVKYQVDCVVGTRARVYGSIPLWKKIDPINISGRVITENNLWKECYGLNDNFKVDDCFPGLVWGRLYRKSCIDKAMTADPNNLFSDSLLEDWWFTLISLRFMRSIYVTNDIVYYWRKGGASSGDLPMLEKSRNYFDYRFDYLSNQNYGGSLLMRTYVCFVKTLYWELHLKIHSKKYDNIQLLVFISDQLKSQKVIGWAKENQLDIPVEIGKFSNPIINNSAEGVLMVACSSDLKSTLKKGIKNVLIQVYNKTCEIGENFGIIK